MDYSKNWQNRRSNDQGALFERLIDQACWNYRTKGIALIEKTPEPFKVMELCGRGIFKGRFLGKAQPDFKGTMSDGQSIVFEAKMTTKDRIQKKVITDNQAACLDIHEELGAITGVCCMIKKTVAFIPWEIWREMKSRYGRQYMTEAEIKKWEVPICGYIDFLDKVRGSGYDKAGQN